MRSVVSLIAAGAATLFSTLAFAADMPIMPPPAYAPPPPADFGGWYLRGDIGFSNQSVKNVRSTNAARYNALTSLNQQTGFDSGGVFDVGVGYQFNSWFRADVTAQYRARSNFKGTDITTFPWANNATPATANGIDNYSGSKSEMLFLANAYVDLGTWWCITPFVGAGVGAARVTVSNFTDNGLTNQNTYVDGFGNVQPYVGGPPVASSYSTSSASRWNFAWAAHAGLAYKVSSNLTLELAYSYVSLGDGYTGPGQTFDNSGGHAPFKFKDITSQDLKLGVRWNFDTPPPPPSMPLIRKG